MKKLISTFSLLFIVFSGFGQTVAVSENFETIADSVIDDPSTSNPTWAITNQVANTGVQSFTAPVTTAQNAARTIKFSTLGNSSVTLTFWHICRIDFVDQAQIQWSADPSSGAWFDIDGSAMDPTSCTFVTFPGAGGLWSSASNLNWDPATPGTPANNSMWCKETFDISFTGFLDSVYVRWLLTDNDGNGANGYPGWYIDDVNITMAPCELVPPVHHVNSLLSGTVYSLGPYTLTDSITDASGIASANIVWTLNGVPQPNITMNQVGVDLYQGVIPAVADSDTVCYYFEAIDGSPCANYSRYPDPNMQCFVATTGIGFPFCDNFDSQNLWVASSVSGSNWDLGTPTSNPSAPHSAPNSWEVAINNTYLNSTECYLTLSQPIEFGSITNAYVEFWFYSDCENTWDGTRLEYRFAGQPAWQVLGTTAPGPGISNWYNDPAINSSLLPGWTGSGTTGPTGWYKAKHPLTPVFQQSQVEFRFVFTSDGSVTDNGFAIDDFCLIVPSPNDAGVSLVSSPSGQYPAGNCENVTVDIINEGTLTLTSIPVTYVNQVTGHTVTETWTGSLAPNATATYTFTVCDTVPDGSYCIQVYTGLAGDGNHFNDTLSSCPFGVPTFVPTACDDFESGAIGWLGQGQWQLGFPAFGSTSGAYSGANAWDINLTGPYQNGVSDTLYSPYYDVSTTVNPLLRFWQNRNTEIEIAGFWIEYQEGNGGWQTLGSTFSGTAATNWHNQTNVAFNGQSGWDGNSNGWIKSTFSLATVLSPNPTTVRFRIVWDAAFGTPLDGVSIDDFCVVAPPGIDAGVIAITAPLGQIPAGNCENVVVTIKNFGTTALTTIPVTYILGAQTGTATYNGNLAPNATTSITISTPCLTIPAGPFTLCAYTGVTGDGDSSNDTTCIDAIGIPVLNLTSCEDFEATNGTWVPSNGTNTSAWEWGTPAYGNTTGAHNSTNAWDINLTSPYVNGMDDTLYTTYYNIIGAINPYMTFWHNRNTIAGDDGYWIEYTTNNGANWQVLGTSAPDPNGLNWYNQVNLDFLNQNAWDGNSSGWVKSTYFLSNVSAGANTIRFRFIFHTTAFGGALDGVSIDDFCVIQPPADDAGVISAVSAAGSVLPQGGNDSVRVDVRNYGVNTINNVGITYAIEQGGTTLFTSSTVGWNGTLLSNQTFGTTVGILTHPDPYVVPSGPYEICAWTTLAGDGDATNDTSCTYGTGVPVIPIDYNTSYCDDFEGSPVWTQSVDPSGNPNSIWELGQPAFGSTSGTHSGNNAWDINLTSAYTNDAYAILTSPIFDFTNAVDTKLSFWRNNNCETNWDGTRMEFSIGGSPWTVLGTCTSIPPVSLNWYNDCTINSSGLDAWNGNSAGWLNSIWYKLDSYGGFTFNNAPTVQFRYIFTSDGSVQQDGFSIDDFCLEVPVPLTSTPTAVGSTNVPAQLIFPGQCITFTGNLKNDGTTALNSMVAELQIDGQTYVTDVVNYPLTLTSGASQVHNFSSCWTATPGAHTICVITSLPNNSADLRPTGDTICYTIVVLDSVDVSHAQYCNDFENPLAPQWLTLNSITYSTNSSWQLGNPNKPTLSGTHSGTNCWVTALDSAQYQNRDTSSLFTPVFRITPGLPYSFEFWGNFDTERNEDGGTVEYSTDYAATWTTLGNERDSVWMNTYHITALGGVPPVRPGWSGSSNNQWERRKHYLCITNPVVSQVIFRYKFSSDFSIRAGGWAIDDVCFGLDLTMPLCVVGINDIDEELGFSLEQNVPNPFNNETIIRFNLLKPGKTSLVITNVMGQVVDMPVNERMLPGTHAVTIDGNKLSAGVYYYTLNFEDKKLTKKMVITE